MGDQQSPSVEPVIRHILVAEDEPLLLDLLTEYLVAGFPGVIVSQATSLAEIRTCLTTASVDVIILDLKLTDSCGIATLTAVADDNPGVPVVVVTGDPDPNIAEHTIAAGAQDYIPKTSLKLDSFIARVQTARDRQQWSRKTLETLRQVSEVLHSNGQPPTSADS
jgi:DNA-binding NarL/FixJ family response regulator